MEKEILVRIHLAKVNFTYVEEQIASYFMKERPALTIHELAHTLSLSSASITRFCKKIGLRNYKELMYLYTKHLSTKKDTQIYNIPMELSREYFRIFRFVDQSFDVKKFKKMAEYIYHHRIIHIFAFGLSATAASDFKFRFSRLGKFIEVIHDKDAIAMATQVLMKDDLVFIFTLRGNMYFENVAQELKEKGSIVLSILGNKKSRLATLSDVVLFTASLSGEESTGMISSQIPILILIDMLYEQYVKMYTEDLHKWVSTEKTLKGVNS